MEEGKDVEWEFFKNGWSLDLEWFPVQYKGPHHEMVAYHQLRELVVVKIVVEYIPFHRGAGLGGGFFWIEAEVIHKESTSNLPIDRRTVYSSKAWSELEADELAELRREVERFVAVYADQPVREAG